MASCLSAAIEIVLPWARLFCVLLPASHPETDWHVIGPPSCWFAVLSYEVQEALGKPLEVVEVFRKAPDVLRFWGAVPSTWCQEGPGLRAAGRMGSGHHTPAGR